MNADMQAWKQQFEDELQHNILRFWMTHTRDEEQGGFYGEISPTMQVQTDAEKGLVLNARILWTFSSAYRLNPDPAYADMANRAYEVLTSQFVDAEFGGLFWAVDPIGRPTADKKQVYGQAFVIYALAEYNRAFGHDQAREQAIALFHLMERYSYDRQYKGYVEALSRAWEPMEEVSLSAKDMNEKKSMNTHLHVLEAYTNLYRIWPADELADKLTELIETTIRYIIDTETGHFHLFLDEAWTVKSDHISYGHDIEGSWLLVEAAQVLENPGLLEQVKTVALKMAEATLKEGVDPDGGLLNEASARDGLIDTNKDWWPQAEAVVGFFNAYQMSGDQSYLEAARNSWSFIQQYLIDRKHGEWYWGVTREGQPVPDAPKVSAWKCPYHNGRACIEMIERIDQLITMEGSR
ncbi:AGE family epimerase/isomerase [Marinicrinis sediminis]|uniref:Cellobiose 2-epimerase n=1 Tax=Marinicrinis sediminis TaxID=1652465 RepID=A0ABW5R8G2_9BACL